MSLSYGFEKQEAITAAFVSSEINKEKVITTALISDEINKEKAATTALIHRLLRREKTVFKFKGFTSLKQMLYPKVEHAHLAGDGFHSKDWGADSVLVIKRLVFDDKHTNFKMSIKFFAKVTYDSDAIGVFPLGEVDL